MNELTKQLKIFLRKESEDKPNRYEFWENVCNFARDEIRLLDDELDGKNDCYWCDREKGKVK